MAVFTDPFDALTNFQQALCHTTFNLKNLKPAISITYR